MQQRCSEQVLVELGFPHTSTGKFSFISKLVRCIFGKVGLWCWRRIIIISTMESVIACRAWKLGDLVKACWIDYEPWVRFWGPWKFNYSEGHTKLAFSFKLFIVQHKIHWIISHCNFTPQQFKTSRQNLWKRFCFHTSKTWMGTHNNNSLTVILRVTSSGFCQITSHQI